MRVNNIRARCSRCRTKFGVSVRADGFVLCPGCDTRLKFRKAAPDEGAAKSAEMTTLRAR